MPRPDGSLTPFEESSSKSAEYGRLGGIKSGEVRRSKRQMKEIAEIILGLRTGKGKKVDIDKANNLDELFEEKTVNGRKTLVPKNLSVEEVIILRQVQLAMNGDIKSAEYVRDITGQNPGTNVKFEGAVPVIITGEDDLIDDESEN